jgi:hypothetical protein
MIKNMGTKAGDAMFSSPDQGQVAAKFTIDIFVGVQ